MMYEALAHFYDALVQDDEATAAWVNLIESRIPKGNIMELACGSGEITIALANAGYHVNASDISGDMIAEAKKKEGSELVTWSTMDMCAFTDTSIYDGILCLCDSFNYLLEEAQVRALFTQVYEHLHDGGCFIMDMHSQDRLLEFQEEYNEAGRIDRQEYQWTIYSEEDCIYQNFAFYDEEGRVTLEQHIQRCYDPLYIEQVLKETGFEVEILTDFTTSGICEGEKQFYICKKVKK